MKATDTISVNPSKTALGHVEKSSSSIFRTRIIEGVYTERTTDFTNLLFPSCKAGLTEYRKYEVPLRTLFATILIVFGVTGLIQYSGVNYEGYAICTLCFGGFLALGLLTRPIMAAASIFYCIMGALSMRSGVADMNSFLLMFGSLLFCIIGSGKYSLDNMIRSSIYHYRKKTALKRKENLMGYKAFHQIKF